MLSAAKAPSDTLGKRVDVERLVNRRDSCLGSGRTKCGVRVRVNGEPRTESAGRDDSALDGLGTHQDRRIHRVERITLECVVDHWDVGSRRHGDRTVGEESSGSLHRPQRIKSVLFCGL